MDSGGGRPVAILNKVVRVGPVEKVTLKQRLEESEVSHKQISVGRTFQVEGTTTAKTSRWEHHWCV